MDYKKQAQKDHEIMRVLKISELSHSIAQTNKGELRLKITKDSTEYQFVLDAVPLPKAENKELLYLFETNDNK